MYASVSCIQPMFHFRLKPSPPMYGGRVTCGHAVDSSAMVSTPGRLGVHDLVHALQERDRLQVLAAAVPVRDPLAGFARVVQVQHRRHGVHPQAVDVVLLDPEHARSR